MSTFGRNITRNLTVFSYNDQHLYIYESLSFIVQPKVKLEKAPLLETFYEKRFLKIYENSQENT